jgi:hypothetical protein
MIETIDIGRLLREALAAPYRTLVTRPTGAAVRGRIEALLDASECPTAALDFSEVELLDLSCADEVVAKLLHAAEARGGRCVVLVGVREDLGEAIDHVLSGQGLAIAAVPRGSAVPELLGRVSADGRAAFRHLREHGPATAAEVAAALGWRADHAQDVLRTLALHRVVRWDGERYHVPPTP